MSKPTPITAALLRPLTSRDPGEHHRAATALELLYDLVLVISVGAAATGLHHAINENHVVAGLGAFAFAFWALWWPWLNFTWFASAYDNDDVGYRILVFVQMIGALILAVGIRDLNAGQLSALPLIGYIIMRIGMIGLWLRVAASNPAARATAQSYAWGIALCQIIWTLWYVFAPSDHMLLWGVPIMALEMLVPMFAERKGRTSWHRHHIVERYGLLVIIVFGESLLSTATAISAIATDNGWSFDLWAGVAASFVILFAMWWIYFGERYHAALNSLRGAFAWGYAHYFVFASAAAVGAGIAALVDQITGKSEIPRALAQAAVVVPVAVYLLSVWFAHDRTSTKATHGRWQLPIFAGLMLITPFVAQGVLLAAALLLVCLTIRIREDAAG